ncbi:MAG: hypothetical protein OXU63_01725, partial [Acidobacteriota bacterium]|nr:hypothetical protein [Acidobacteriota bacterium]
RFDNFCLVSCFVDGEATAAIAAVTVSSPAQDGGDGPEYLISPLFVCPTPAPERPVSPTDSLPKREPAHEPRQPHP